jgi:hypothetical protein
MKRNHLRLAPTVLTAVLLTFAATWAVQAKIIEYTPLTPQQVSRLTKDAREAYDQALTALDKINYKLGLAQLTKAIEIEPDNVHLRFMVVQIARYMGAKSSGSESIKYYDLAIQHLKAIADSSRLNSREKLRADESIEEVTNLRNTVTERDEARRKAGLGLAIKHVNLVYTKTEAELEEEAQAKRFKATEQLRQTLASSVSGTTPPAGAAPVATPAMAPGMAPATGIAPGLAEMPPQPLPAEMGLPLPGMEAPPPGPAAGTMAP